MKDPKRQSSPSMLLLMQPHFSIFGHVILAVDQDLDLIAYLAKPTQHLFISVDECKNRIRNVSVIAELPDELLKPAEVVARNAGKEVVHGLELKAAVDEVEPGGAVDIHGGAELTLGEGLGLAMVRS